MVGVLFHNLRNYICDLRSLATPYVASFLHKLNERGEMTYASPKFLVLTSVSLRSYFQSKMPKMCPQTLCDFTLQCCFLLIFFKLSQVLD